MDRSKEKRIKADHMTLNILNEGIELTKQDDRIKIDDDSEIMVFMGDPNMGMQLGISGIAARMGENGEKDKLVLIVEPQIDTIGGMLSDMISESKRSTDPDSLEGELGMKPPTPGCDCEACTEKRRFIDLCNNAEAQDAKDNNSTH